MKTIERTCAIAYSLNLLGDKWSLLILRDVILHKKSKFKDFIDSIFNDMQKGVCKGSDVYFVEDRRRAIDLALDAADEDDCVLIAGKGHEAYQEVQYTAIPFDDRLVAGGLLDAKVFGG